MKRRRRIGATVLALTLVGVLFAGAAPVAAQQEDIDDDDVEHVVDVYNENIDDAPETLQNLLSGETIELRVGDGDQVASEDSGEAFHLNLDDDAKVEEYGEGPADDPTVRVLTSENAIERIVEHERPADQFVEEYDDGEIQFEGVGFVNTVKVEAVKTAAWLVRTAGLL